MKKNTSKYSVDAMNIRSFMNKIDETAKMLKEAYVYEDDMEMGDEETVVDGEEPIDGELCSEDKGKEYVDAIRKSALQGIQVFADDVDCPSYQFFKKVFMLADKVLSEKESEDSDE